MYLVTLHHCYSVLKISAVVVMEGHFLCHLETKHEEEFTFFDYPH